MAQFWVTKYSYSIGSSEEEIKSARNIALMDHRKYSATVLDWDGKVRFGVPETIVEEIIWGTHPSGSDLDYKDLETLFNEYPVVLDDEFFSKPFEESNSLIGMVVLAQLRKRK